MKKFFTNKPWKTWKTRKLILVLTNIAVVLFIICCLFLIATGIQIDTTSLIDNVFKYAEILISLGAGITVSKVLKGKTNSDDDEDELQ